MANDPHLNRNQQAPQHSNRRQQHQQHHQQLQIQQNNEHDDEVSEEIISVPYRRAYEMAEKFAATRIGQFIITRGDSMLKIIEATAKWSLPKAQLDDKLQRPLSWLPFLMLIITLRLARVGLSIAALMIGNAPVKAHDVVYFIQTRRRKLRSLRLNGIRKMNEDNAVKRTGYQNKTLKSLLTTLFNRAICRPGQQQHNTSEPHIYILGSDLNAIRTTVDHQAAKRLRCDDDCDANLTVHELLNKYGSENNDNDDPDFEPDEEEAHETSATSTASSESNVEAELVFHEHSRDHVESTQFDQSVEMLENANNMETLPKPMIEIKKEMNSSDVESNEMKAGHENGPTNGDENRAADVGNGY